MSTQVEINGITFLPIKDAAKLVSYSRDYVARLAREQKIVATQIGRQWFIDTISLKNFAEISELELSVRKQQLSVERKREQIVKQEVKEVHLSLKSKLQAVHLRAQLAAVFVLGFGLLAGAGLYTTSNLFPSQTSSLARLGNVTELKAADTNPVSKVSEENSLEFKIAKPQATTHFTTLLETPVFTDEAETRTMSPENSAGIFLLAGEGEVRNAKEIKSLFSDEVEVNFLAEGSGVITYTKEEEEITAFPFVTLPLHNAAEKTSSEKTL